MQGQFGLKILTVVLIGLASAPASALDLDFLGFGSGVTSTAGFESAGSASGGSKHSADQCPGGRVAPVVNPESHPNTVAAHPGATPAAKALNRNPIGAAPPQAKPALLRWQSHLPGAMK